MEELDMLFSESELMNGRSYESILNEAVYLDDYESTVAPNTIPVVENSRLNVGVVDFNDVNKLAEEYGTSCIEAQAMIAESNNLHIGDLAVAINEADVILYPGIVNFVENAVIKPISPDSDAYKFCENCMENYFATGNDNYITYFVEEKNYGYANLDDIANDDVASRYKPNQELGLTANALNSFDANTRKQVLSQIKIVDIDGKSPGFIANKIAAIRAWAARKIKEREDAGDDAGLITKFKAVIAKIIRWLNDKLSKTKIDTDKTSKYNYYDNSKYVGRFDVDKLKKYDEKRTKERNKLADRLNKYNNN